MDKTRLLKKQAKDVWLAPVPVFATIPTEHEHLPGLFSARATLRKTRSEPLLLRRDPFGEAQAREKRQEFRKGLAEMLEIMDQQTVQKEKERLKRIASEKALQRKEVERERARQFLNHQRPDWVPYVDPPGYFEHPLVDSTGSLTCVKNGFLQGMWDTAGWKPPHHENNVYGGWNYFATNDQGEVLGYFGAKARERMAPTELKFAERLDRKLARAAKLIARDAHHKTDGKFRKKFVEEHSDEFSCLKRDKPAWNTQNVTTHTYFSSPDPYAPGDHKYVTGLREYIEQPTRAKSSERDFIAGDPERTVFWQNRPAGAVCGSVRMLAMAQELTCPRGCRALLKEDRAVQLWKKMEQKKKSPRGHSPKT